MRTLLLYLRYTNIKTLLLYFTILNSLQGISGEDLRILKAKLQQEVVFNHALLLFTLWAEPVCSILALVVVQLERVLYGRSEFNVSTCYVYAFHPAQCVMGMELETCCGYLSGYRNFDVKLVFRRHLKILAWLWFTHSFPQLKSGWLSGFVKTRMVWMLKQKRLPKKM